MTKTSILNESIDSLDNVINGEIGANTHLDTTEASAYNDECVIDKHLEEVDKDLKKKATSVTPGSSKRDTMNIKNTYTKTYTLDESLKDFNLKESLLEDTDDKGNALWKSLSDKDDENPYLDFTMQDFVTSLANYSSSIHATVNPLEKGVKYKRFRNDTEKGFSQISTDGAGNISLGSDDASDFDYISKILDTYGIKHSAPIHTKYADWEYHMHIDVPKIAPGYPMLMVDYFEDRGIDPASVMASDKWADGYRNAVAKLQKEAEKELSRLEKDRQRRQKAKERAGESPALKSIYDKAVTYAWQRGDIELSDHLKSLYAELDAAGVAYSKTAIKKKFMAEFEDEFEDED